jgi:hypothetical protein
MKAFKAQKINKNLCLTLKRKKMINTIMNKSTLKTLVLTLPFSVLTVGAIQAAPKDKADNTAAAEAKGKANAIEFAKLDKTNKIPGTPVGALKDIGNGTFYYLNNDGNPEFAPKVSDVDGVKAIELVPSTDAPSKPGEAQLFLTRIVKIPDNAPATILATFKTRLTAGKLDTSWLPRTAQIKDAYMKISFMKEDGFEGGGKTIALGEPNGKWVDHSETINIPKTARYMRITLGTDAGKTLSLGNWKIE